MRGPPLDGSVRMGCDAATRGRDAAAPRCGVVGRHVVASCRDPGSATVAVVGAVGVLLAMLIGALLVISAVVASHRAQSAADLAALGAAATLVRGEPAEAACATAGAVASLNGAGLATCQTAPDLTVEVVVRVVATMPHVGVASARSRAGPSPGRSP